jgi:hypothetical protein
MDSAQVFILQPRTANQGQVHSLGQGAWQLQIPAGPPGQYRLAQLDDYGKLARGAFPWQAPFRLELQARASAKVIPGTWGFGLWNDPFSIGALGGQRRLTRLPTFPNVAWFFFAAPPNHLSLLDDQPGQGWLAMSFRAPHQPGAWLAACLPLAPLLLLPALARRLRAFISRLVGSSAALLPVDPTEWHTYRLEWQAERVQFSLDGQFVLESQAAPAGRLGLVLWVDNQYAAWKPDGGLDWGLLANPEPAWLEIRDLQYGQTAISA